MMDAKEFAERLRNARTIEDFEDWFDSSSWDVHQQGDAALTAAVFEFEELYSAHLDGRMGPDSVRQEMHRLAGTVRPFAPASGYARPFDGVRHDVTKFATGPEGIFPYARSDEKVCEPSSSLVGSSRPIHYRSAACPAP